jgi:imidazoleglycerol-phosphate dehydratase
MIGQLDTQLVFEFFQGFVNHAGVTLHIDNLKGVNAHHQCGDHVQGLCPCAAHGARNRDPRLGDAVIPSTKGSL